MKGTDMRRIAIFSTLLAVSLCGFGQSFHKNSWSYNLYLGGSSLLGDLGGGGANGGLGTRDIDLRATRTAIGIGAGYDMRSVSFSSNLTFIRLAGNDAFSQSESRSTRNLSVRTDVIEFNILGELRPFGSTPILKRVYVFGGVGGIFYQPKAELNDAWVKLRPLGTEGQLLDGGTAYNKFSLVIPYGAGYKFPLGESSTLNLEIGLRKSFTDYIDDVSGVYANNAVLLETSGSDAAALADRSGLSYAEGAQRGNSEVKDNYFLVGLKFQKTIGKKQTSCFYDDVPARNQRRIRKHQRRMFRR
jgi:hypothetical protein